MILRTKAQVGKSVITFVTHLWQFEEMHSCKQVYNIHFNVAVCNPPLTHMHILTYSLL